MHITRRFLYFLLPAAVLILLHGLAASLLYLGGIYLVILLFVGIIDYRSNPLYQSVEIHREMNTKFSFRCSEYSENKGYQPFSVSGPTASKR